MQRYTLRAIGFILGLAVAAAAGAQLNEQKSTEGGVTVLATPQAISAAAKTWNFNGPRPGSHHRSGVLKFAAGKRLPQSHGNAHVPPRRGQAALVPLAPQVAV